MKFAVANGRFKKRRHKYEILRSQTLASKFVHLYYKLFLNLRMV